MGAKEHVSQENGCFSPGYMLQRQSKVCQPLRQTLKNPYIYLICSILKIKHIRLKLVSRSLKQLISINRHFVIFISIFDKIDLKLKKVFLQIVYMCGETQEKTTELRIFTLSGDMEHESFIDGMGIF